MIAQDEEEEFSEQESETPHIEPYDFKNLPAHSCVYCGIHEERCVVKCKSKNCNKWLIIISQTEKHIKVVENDD